MKTKSSSFHYKMPINIRGQLISKIEITEFIFEKDSSPLYSHRIGFLPGLHTETLQDKEKNIINFFNDHELDDFSVTKNLIISPFIDDSIPNESRFAIESIIINYYHFKNPELLNKTSTKINYLYDPNETQLNNKGIYKVKITNQNIIEDLIEILSQDFVLKIRFDANRSLTKEELVNFIKDLPEKILNKIDYFEEPTTNFNEALEVLKSFNLKLGIDESLIEYLASLTSPSKDIIAILKPSLFGIAKSISYIDRLHSFGIPTIISSSFDFELELRILILLSDYTNRLTSLDLHHGLDTLKYLSNESTLISQTNNELTLLKF